MGVGVLPERSGCKRCSGIFGNPIWVGGGLGGGGGSDSDAPSDPPMYIYASVAIFGFYSADTSGFF